MAESFVQIPSEVGNQGKKMRTVTSVQGGETVHEHVIEVSNFPTPQTDALTDAQLRATAVPVSGPLTDDALRAADLVVAVSQVQIGELLDALREIKLEVRLMSQLLNEGLNLKEDLDVLKHDVETDLE